MAKRHFKHKGSKRKIGWADVFLPITILSVIGVLFVLIGTNLGCNASPPVGWENVETKLSIVVKVTVKGSEEEETANMSLYIDEDSLIFEGPVLDIGEKDSEVYLTMTDDKVSTVMPVPYGELMKLDIFSGYYSEESAHTLFLSFYVDCEGNIWISPSGVLELKEA